MEADRPHPVPGEGRPIETLIAEGERLIRSDARGRGALVLLHWTHRNLPALLASLRSSRDERRQMEEALEDARPFVRHVPTCGFFIGGAWVSDGAVEHWVEGVCTCGKEALIARIDAALRSSSSTPEEAPNG